MRVKIYTVLLIVLFVPSFAAAQPTEFTFQGSLKNSGVAASGNYDFEFRLFDSLAGGSQIGSLITRTNVPVANGIFSVKLDFGAAFSGADRYLEIQVRNVGGGAYTLLDPRQRVNSAPYAVKSIASETAATATNATQLGGLAANTYLQTNGNASSLTNLNASNMTTGTLSNARLGVVPIANGGTGSATQNFVDLTNAQGIGGNKTFSGTLSGNAVNSVTQYNIAGSRILSNAGTDNLFAGVSAGSVNTGASNSFFGRRSGFSNATGADNSFFGAFSGDANTFGVSNSFFGAFAGRLNTFGADNSFFGRSSGEANTTGVSNSFFGRSSGGANKTGSSNSFFGRNSGAANTFGDSNSFFGSSSGGANTEGIDNSFFGVSSGLANTEGSYNSFFGLMSGGANTTGSKNSFFGRNSGQSNIAGSNNTIIGEDADVATGPLNFATAIGSGAVVTTSNRIQLGRAGLDAVRIGLLASPSATQLCIITATNTLAECTSSGRYKENIKPFSAGLNHVKRLNPVTYDWIESKEPDLGLIAEEVAAVEPLLVTYNHKGEIQGVKYDQITVVLINVVKEQQSQIETQQKQIEQQRKQIESLTKIVCAINSKAGICRQ
jgi:hypothetical protein